MVLLSKSFVQTDGIHCSKIVLKYKSDQSFPCFQWLRDSRLPRNMKSSKFCSHHFSVSFSHFHSCMYEFHMYVYVCISHACFCVHSMCVSYVCVCISHVCLCMHFTYMYMCAFHMCVYVCISRVCLCMCFICLFMYAFHLYVYVFVCLLECESRRARAVCMHSRSSPVHGTL